MIKTLIKKLLLEMKKSNNQGKTKIILFELLLFVSYLICMIVQYVSETEIKQIMYLMRWMIMVVAVIVWWIHSRKEKKRASGI